MLTELQHDTIKEIVNMGVGRGASMLGNMVNVEIRLSIPEVEIITQKKYAARLNKMEKSAEFHIVEMAFTGNYKGNIQLILGKEEARNIVSVLLSTEDVAEMVDNVVLEISNIILNSVMGTFSNVLGNVLNYSLPDGKVETLYEYIEEKVSNMSGGFMLICKTEFTIRFEKRATGNILILFDSNSFNSLKRDIDNISNTKKHYINPEF